VSLKKVQILLNLKKIKYIEPFIDKLKQPNLSPDNESAPHCKTTASG